MSDYTSQIFRELNKELKLTKHRWTSKKGEVYQIRISNKGEMSLWCDSKDLTADEDGFSIAGFDLLDEILRLKTEGKIAPRERDQ